MHDRNRPYTWACLLIYRGLRLHILYPNKIFQNFYFEVSSWFNRTVLVFETRLVVRVFEFDNNILAYSTCLFKIYKFIEIVHWCFNSHKPVISCFWPSVQKPIPNFDMVAIFVSAIFGKQQQQQQQQNQKTNKDERGARATHSHVSAKCVILVV